ncbi:hypothetical protein LG325_05060 [Marinobacter nauticus]
MNKMTLGALLVVSTLGLAACGSEEEQGSEFEQAAENTEEMVNDAGNAVGETYEETTGQDEGALGELQEGAAEAGEEIGESAEEAGEEVVESAEEAGDSIEEGYDEATY